MPSEKDKKGVFNGLVENGLDFIERSSQDLANGDLKIAITHFAIGLELILKARLFVEHWSLIGQDPRKCTWIMVKNGSLKSIQAHELCNAIETATETSIDDKKEIFLSIFNHRNKIVHWIPSDQSKTEIAAEQCVAWYSLRQLLKNSWKEQFLPIFARIDAVENSLKKVAVYQKCLKKVYEKLQPMLEDAKAKGALLNCPSCDYESGVLLNPELEISDYSCQVCHATGVAGRFKCGISIDLDSLRYCDPCSCGEEHSTDELIDLLDPAPSGSPKERSMSDRLNCHCAECLHYEPTVVRVGEHYRCVLCYSRFLPQDIGPCECCNVMWAGAMLSESFQLGCEHCDGHAGHIRDRD